MDSTERQPTQPAPEPLTMLAEGAAQVHELFRSYVNAGFTEQQALYLIAQLITSLQTPEAKP